MGILLFFGLAFKRSGDGFESGPVLCFEEVLKRAPAIAVAVLNDLHATDTCNKGHCAENSERRGLYGHALDVEASELDCAEKLFNHPVPAVELRDPTRPLEALNPVAGQQTPVRGNHPVGRVDFARLDNRGGRAAVSGVTGLFFGFLSATLPKRTPKRALRLLRPGRAGRLIAHSSSGAFSRLEKSLPAPSATTRSCAVRTRISKPAGLLLANIS